MGGGKTGVAGRYTVSGFTLDNTEPVLEDRNQSCQNLPKPCHQSCADLRKAIR